MRYAIAFLSSIFLLVSGCAKPGSFQANMSGDAEVGIVGGTRVMPNDIISDITVGIYHTSLHYICTGSIIANNIILTAAHCLEGDAKDIVIVFGVNFNIKENVQVRKAVDYAVNPRYPDHHEDAEQTGDIGLIRFEGGLPFGFHPARLLKVSSYLGDGVPVVLAGYGRTSGTENTGTAVLRKVNVNILNASFSKTEIEIDQSQKRGACNGDSGGPAYYYVAGEMYLWGVTSRGAEGCVDSSIYTNLIVYRNWIRKIAGKWNPMLEGTI